MIGVRVSGRQTTPADANEMSARTKNTRELQKGIAGKRAAGSSPELPALIYKIPHMRYFVCQFYTEGSITLATIYLAGGLFNAGERLHNLFLARALKVLGHFVILPQVEALNHLKDGKFDLSGIVQSCQKSCSDPSHVYVGNSDGADADSGTCVEYGMAITATGHAIVYRTDFRTAEDRELGVNAMLKAPGTTFIYHPCFFTELDQVEVYYKELALKIHQAIG
jgi:nucleoside 2-deoxyribosyltransferase